MEIDLLGPADWQDLKSVRLAALQDAPDAFVATWSEELRRTPDCWIGCIESSTWAVARHSGQAVGIARLTMSGSGREHFIESVWVDRSYRARGLVRQMLSRLEQESRSRRAECLQLWVLEDNLSAYDAYIKLCFYEVPEREQDSPKRRVDGTAVRERLMIRPLL